MINLILNFARNLTRNVKFPKEFIISSKRYKNSKMSTEGADHIVWVDLEMSGLNIEKDHILEMACLITDKQLNIIAEGPEIVINQSDTVLNSMDEWCTKTHSKSGLTDAVKNSKITLDKAENIMLEFIQNYVPKNSCPLAGNSVYMDRLFLNKYMKRYNQHLHYRIIDVSTVKELNFRWYPGNKDSKQKKFNHRALDDIKESIEELKFYRNTIFKN